MTRSRFASILAVLGVALGLVCIRVPAAPTATPRAQPAGSVSRSTGPGIGLPAKNDPLPGRVVRGALLVLLAAAVVGWLFRARVRRRMIGGPGEQDPPPGGAPSG